MKIDKIIEALECKVLVEGNVEDISDGYTSDLLSDVMGNCPEGSIWITIQRHMNVIAVAQLKRISAIVLVNGIVPDDAVLERAKEEGIHVLSTPFHAFKATGRVFGLLNTTGS